MQRSAIKSHNLHLVQHDAMPYNSDNAMQYNTVLDPRFDSYQYNRKRLSKPIWVRRSLCNPGYPDKLTWWIMENITLGSLWMNHNGFGYLRLDSHDKAAHISHNCCLVYSLCWFSTEKIHFVFTILLVQQRLQCNLTFYRFSTTVINIYI